MKKTLLALSAVSALALAGAGFAQTAPAPNPAAQHLSHQRGAAAPERRMERFDPAKMAERRTERLHTLLQLRPEQEGALKAFVDATTPKGPPQGRMGERGKGDPGAERPNLTMPQRLDAARKHMAERQARFDRISAATLKFYGQLSPSQQKVFDTQAHGLREHRRGPGGGFRGHRGGRPGMEGPRGGAGGQPWGPQGGPMGGPPR